MEEMDRLSDTIIMKNIFLAPAGCLMFLDISRRLEDNL